MLMTVRATFCQSGLSCRQGKNTRSIGERVYKLVIHDEDYLITDLFDTRQDPKKMNDLDK